MTAQVKGFGCRPVVTYPRALGPASESPPGRNPRGPHGRLLSMGICRGGGLGRGRAGRGSWRRIDNRGARIVVAAVVDGAILA
jgi:hypothetical protein